jgi:putative thioredoxin
MERIGAVPASGTMLMSHAQEVRQAMNTPASVRDVDESGFEREVLARSHSVPVVVDFWAPWCGPCRQLGPVLERLVASYEGRIELAKLNTDEHPALAQQYRVEGIPAVKAFRDGRVVSEFTGALPEHQVRAFLQRLVPSRADELAAEAATLAYSGNRTGAEESYRQALEEDRGHRAASIGLARLLAARDQDQEAIAILASLPADEEAARLRAELTLKQAATGADEPSYEARLANDPADLDAAYRLALALAARGEYERALEYLLGVVRRDRRYGDDAGRKAMLDIFALLGDESPLTRTYRRRLSNVLF